MRYILDTDHVSLLQRGNARIAANLARIDVANCAVTIITAVEQIQGRLAVIRRARIEADAARGFEGLRETVAFFSSVQVLPYDTPAVAEFERLRNEGIRIGTQDLRIASIVLSRDATLITRNTRDFNLVPTLRIIDWSV
jgi:tRNA(fMet)-specific endonuclease VapC